ncbi:MAG: hypothetical protein ACE5F1_04190 [Planctomycetota bacterium]
MVWKLLDPKADPDHSWKWLLDRYREPIRKCVRLHLRGSPDTDQVADEFFSYLFMKSILPKVDPRRGKFRAFIQGVLRLYLKHHLRNGDRAGNLDEADNIAARLEDPEIEKQEERVWAQRVFELSLKRLMAEMPRDSEILIQSSGIPKPGAAGGALPSHPKPPRNELARRFALKPNAIDQAKHRARQRLRVLIRRELKATVASLSELREEYRLVESRFLSALSGNRN